MPSEWLLRLRALRQGSDFLETCANRANRASSPTNERAVATQSTNAAAFGWKAHRADHGTTRSISARNAARRVVPPRQLPDQTDYCLAG